jgi:pimeloyl-ACP methyl ester carboxylesterase
MTFDYSLFCSEKASYEAGYTDLETGVSLLTVKFTPETGINYPLIIFIPGLASVIENFRETLVSLTSHHSLHYIETREKSTAIITHHHGFSVPDLASDLVSYINSFIPPDKPYILVGYSLGTTVITEAFRKLICKPDRIVFVEPSIEFHFPGWLLMLASVAKPVYRTVKPFLKWYMRTFRIDTNEDYEMYRINCRILDKAEPRRLGLTVRSILPYSAAKLLGSIDVPVMVVGASKDRFHNLDAALDFSEAIKDCSYHDLENNKRTHSSEIADLISSFFSKASNTPSLMG